MINSFHVYITQYAIKSASKHRKTGNHT